MPNDILASPMAPAVIDHSVRAHHKHGMSRLPHYEKCAKFQSQSGVDNAAAQEGTYNHEIVEGIIGAWLEERQTVPFLTLAQTLEMALAAELVLEPGQVVAVREVLHLIDSYWPDAVEMLVEERMTIYNPDGSEFIFGTSDLIFLYADGSAVIIDYKFGQGIVDDAAINKQGWGYALGLFQRSFLDWPLIGTSESPKAVKVVFVQPRINFVTGHTFLRSDMPLMYHSLVELVRRAEDPTAERIPGDQCRYCADRGTCSALLNLAGKIASKVHAIEMPKTFDPSLITEPADMALAYWFCKNAEPAIEAIKAAAVKMALEGFELKTVVNGREVSWETGTRNANRELGPSPLIYQQVKDVLDQDMYNAATEVKLGALEKIFAEALVERTKAKGEKLTKKAATEELNKRLSEAGLVTRSETKITFLREVKQKPQEVIEV